MAKARPSKTSEADGDDAPPRFEQALGGLEQAVKRLESGELSLDDALACYEQGLKQIIYCRTLLDDAERRVALLTGVNGDGSPATTPYDATATYDPKAAEPSSGRPRPAATPADDDDDAPF